MNPAVGQRLGLGGLQSRQTTRPRQLANQGSMSPSINKGCYNAYYCTRCCNTADHWFSGSSRGGWVRLGKAPRATELIPAAAPSTLVETQAAHSSFGVVVVAPLSYTAVFGAADLVSE